MTWNRPEIESDDVRRVTRSPVITREEPSDALFMGNVSICTSHSSQNYEGLDCSPIRKVSVCFRSLNNVFEVFIMCPDIGPKLL